MSFSPPYSLHVLTTRLWLVWLLMFAGLGCSSTTEPIPDRTVGKTTTKPDYSRPLPPGASALRKLDVQDWPDLGAAWRERSPLLSDALDHSLVWFAAPSSTQFFPFQGITHAKAQESVVAFADLLDQSRSESEFMAGLQDRFDVYQSVGWNGKGTVLFTGYYAPIFNASRTRSVRFSAPLYTRPADLVTDERTGEPLGRRGQDGSIRPYPARAEIEASGMFVGSELVWLENKLDAFIVHVNGSARLRMHGGGTMHIGYAGKTDRPYGSMGLSLVDAGVISKDELSLSAIKRVYRRDPREVEKHMGANESYVFFQEYDADRWPSGSLGVPVTSESSLATDKSIFPRGGVVFVDTRAMTFGSGTKSFRRFMLDQDTGGAIKAPGRADLFMGIGESAEILAGGQYAEGGLYYLFLRE